jgi:uncharacterized protein YjbI with pentapeptide repeats
MSVATRQSIEDLLKAVNDASGSARGLFITLMVLALYFLIVVSGTDDLALLRNATVAVPTLSNATLPARSFYMCAPLIFVFLHLDLLIHLKLLSDKLYRYNELLETSGMDEATVRDYRLRLAGFPFSNWLGSDPRTGRIAYALQGAIVWITLVLLPLAVLLTMQLGFLAYQSEAVTWLHRGALIVDAGLLLYFWEAFQRGRYRPPDAVRAGMKGIAGAFLHERFLAFRRKYQRADRVRADRWQFSVIGRAARALRRVWVELIESAFVLVALLVFALLLVLLFHAWVQGHFIASIVLVLSGLFVFAWVGPQLPSLSRALRQSSGDLALSSSTFTSRRWPVFVPVTFLLLVSLTVATIPDEAADRTSRWLYSWMEGQTLTARDTKSAVVGLSSDDLNMQIESLVEGEKSTDAKLLERMAGSRCMRWLVSVLPGMPDSDARLLDAQGKGSALAFHLERVNRMPNNMRASCPTIALFHLKGSWFHRTLTVTGKVVARSDVKPKLAKDLRASLRKYKERAEEGKGPDAVLVNEYDDLIAQVEGLDLSERRLRWANFEDVALPKVVLDRAQLQYVILKSADLRKAILVQATLTGADMTEATLTDAKMEGATLTDAKMEGATLTRANMQKATLTRANMSRATLTEAKMEGATLTDVKMFKANLTRANMSRAVLTNAKMEGATLTRANMEGATLTRANMQKATLTHVNMTNATLTGADMWGANLTGADMAEAMLASASMWGATLTGARMYRAKLIGANMTDAILIGANLNGAILIGARMYRATLTRASMWRATLAGADMREASLTGAIMREATLTGANMNGATLTGANLQRASVRGARLPRESERKRWAIVEGMIAGSYSTDDIASDVLSLKQVAAEAHLPSESKAIFAQIDKLVAYAGKPTSANDFPDCIGGPPCIDDKARQRRSALDRAAHFENLICASDRRVAVERDFDQRRSDHDASYYLVWDLRDDFNPGSYLKSASTDALRRLATRCCAPPEAQRLIDDWARRNPPPEKEAKP